MTPEQVTFADESCRLQLYLNCRLELLCLRKVILSFFLMVFVCFCLSSLLAGLHNNYKTNFEDIFSKITAILIHGQFKGTV